MTGEPKISTSKRGNKPTPEDMLPVGPRGPLGKHAYICIPKGNAEVLYNFVKKDMDSLLEEILRNADEMKKHCRDSCEHREVDDSSNV